MTIKCYKTANLAISFNPVTLKFEQSPSEEHFDYEQELTQAYSILEAVIQPDILITRARIVLTEQCNFRCTYCFVMDQQDKLKTMAATTLDEICLFLQKFGDKKGIVIQLFGGEPLIERGKIVEIINFFNTTELADKIRFEINSNASLVKRINFDELLPFKDKINFTCSLDSPDPTMNDSFRKLVSGRGTFELTVEGIKILIAHGFNVGLLYTPQNKTLISLPRLLVFAKKLGCSGVDINTPQPEKNDWPIDGELFFKTLLAARKIAKSIGMGCSSELDKVEYILNEQIPNVGSCSSLCGMGMSISTEGKISNCIVNWNDLPKLTQTVGDFDINKSRNFKNGRKKIPAMCKSCIAHSTCGGFCGLELALGKSEDPSKSLEKCTFYRSATTYFVEEIAKKLMAEKKA